MHTILSGSLSPNTERDDVWRAMKTLTSPWHWQHGHELEKVKLWFRDAYKTDAVYLFNSGRSAMLAILRAFGIGPGDEVIVQAFTCVAVPNSVLWAGATPVYADIDGTYNIDPAQLASRITKRTKAIVVQHTFGIPASLDEISAIAKKHGLFLIEDCAHALGATYKGKRPGSFGDAAFFSFGRDKALSSVWGGAAILNVPKEIHSDRLRKYYKTLPMPGIAWIVQQLLHPIMFSLILPGYRLIVGKVLLVTLQKLRLLSYPVYPEEKHGAKPPDFPARYPNALASLLVLQLKKLSRFTQTRQQAAATYAKQLSGREGIGCVPPVTGASYLRYPVRVPTPERLLKLGRKRGVLLGNWYHHTIDPTGVDFAAIKYRPGSCPVAEDAALHVVNLPTLIPTRHIRHVLSVFGTI